MERDGQDMMHALRKRERDLLKMLGVDEVTMLK